MPKVSVIIPAYNNGIYLPESIESVLKQTYQDFEILVIDDGSTDKTRETAERYAREYPHRVRYAYQENRGAGAARNKGLTQAKGEYLAFLDADDRWLSTKLEKQVHLLDSRPDIGLVYTNLFFVDRENNVVRHGTLDGFSLPRGEVSLFFYFRYFMYTSTVMLRKRCAERVGFFREDISVSEDFDFLLRVSAVCKVECQEEKLLAKRSREDSLSSIDGMQNARNDLAVLTDFITKNPGFFGKHRKLISTMLGKRNGDLGYWSLKRGNKLFSLPYVLASLRYGPSVKAVKCLVQIALPLKIVHFA
ncbi:MAG: glycosyltransferase family 2 protein, partial [Endomicrobiales bacterium]